MAEAVGALVKAAFKKDPKDSAYPYTAWADDALGSGDQVPLLSEAVAAKQKFEKDETLEGRAGLRGMDLLGVDVAGPLTLMGRYNNIGRLVAMAMGWENPNDPGATYHGSPETVSGKYKHVFELDDVLNRQTWVLDGDRLPSGSGGGIWSSGDQKVRSGCLIVGKQVNDWRFFSCMVNKMKITIEPPRTSFEFELLAYNYGRGSYNSSAFTLATDQRNMIFPDYVFTIGTTEYGISRLEILLDNKLAAERDTVSGLYLAEPVRNGMRTVTFGWDFLRHSDETLFDDADALTEQYASIKATSGNYAFGAYFSAFKMEALEAPASGPGIIRSKFQATAYKPSTDRFSSEWSNIALKKNKEMVLMLVNDHSSNYLTEN